LDELSEDMTMHTRIEKRREIGFSLIETMFAIMVLSFGVLSLAAVLASGLAYMNSSQSDFIAQQKASEAAESIFTARDSGALAWPAILNVSAAGIFSDGPQQLCDPGPDGILGTADDDCAKPDCIQSPGPDGILGTADDMCMPLPAFTRTILITPNINANPGLRQITVTMNYKSGRFQRQYQLVTYISATF
jgi:type II secretory pathway pseudopilin PulG